MDFDFLSSNLQIAYPFTDNVTVGRFGADTELAPIVAAAQIRTVDQREELLSVERIYIKSSSFPATIEDAILKLVWMTSGDIVELDLTAGTTQFSANTYGSWIVVEWYAPEELSGESDIFVKFVFPSSMVESSGGFDYIQIDKDTEDIVLHASTVKQGPNAVRRVYWKYGDTMELVADRGEEFVVQAGFNMSIGAAEAEDEDTGRNLTRVAIDAVPGAGFGKYLICRGSQYLITVNGVKGNDVGDLVLKPLECYYDTRDLETAIVPQPEEHGITGTATLKEHEVSLGNSCVACCSCEDYILTYQNLHRLYELAKAVSNRICVLQEQYTQLVEDYEELVGQCIPMECSFEQLNESQVKVTVTLCNDTDITINNLLAAVPIEPLHIDIEFDIPDAVGWYYLSGSGYLQGSIGSNQLEPEAWTGASVELLPNLPVPPNTNLSWVSVWRVEHGAEETLEMTATAYEGELPEPRSASANITLAEEE
jgi:hypothetical protein